jgi:hypothetical protein
LPAANRQRKAYWIVTGHRELHLGTGWHSGGRGHRRGSRPNLAERDDHDHHSLDPKAREKTRESA